MSHRGSQRRRRRAAPLRGTDPQPDQHHGCEGRDHATASGQGDRPGFPSTPTRWVRTVCSWVVAASLASLTRLRTRALTSSLAASWSTVSASSSRVRAMSASISATSGVSSARLRSGVSSRSKARCVVVVHRGPSLTSMRWSSGPGRQWCRVADGVDVTLDAVHGPARDRGRGFLDALLAHQRSDSGGGQQNDADDEGREPSVQRQCEGEDRGGNEHADAVQGEKSGGAEHAGADSGLLRLAGHFELSEAELVAHQLGQLAGESRDQFPGRRVTRPPATRCPGRRPGRRRGSRDPPLAPRPGAGRLGAARRWAG